MDNNSEAYESDKLLVSKVLQGDHAAFAQLIKNSERMMAQVICNMIKNSDDQKDIAQEVYLKVYKYLSGFKFKAKLSTWMCQIAYNTCINHLKKKQHLSLDDITSKVTTSEVEHETKASFYVLAEAQDTLAHQQDLTELLKREIQKLPPVYQTLISLYHQEELSYTEITQITELPEGTVKNYLYRARQTLRENILINYKREDL